MPLTFLLVFGAVLAVTTRFILVSPRPEDVALSGQSPASRSTDPASDTAAGSETQASGPAPAEWRLMTVTTLRDAEQLLDWLEAHGHADRELIVLGNSNFAVRWR